VPLDRIVQRSTSKSKLGYACLSFHPYLELSNTPLAVKYEPDLDSGYAIRQAPAHPEPFREKLEKAPDCGKLTRWCQSVCHGRAANEQYRLGCLYEVYLSVRKESVFSASGQELGVQSRQSQTLDRSLCDGGQRGLGSEENCSGV